MSFTFNNVSSDTFGAVVFPFQIDNAESQQYSAQTIPGRSGDLIYADHRYPNIQHSYDVVIHSSFQTNFKAMRSFLTASNGYQRLEDTYNTDEYYMAVFQGVIEPTLHTDRALGKFRVVFNRKPQRYLKTGETTTNYTANATITNPTAFNAKPLLRVYGAGTLQIGNGAIVISSADEYTDIDCETMEAYKGTLSCNGRVSVSGYDFPVLTPGDNGLVLGTGITQVNVTPRWWRI